MRVATGEIEHLVGLQFLSLPASGECDAAFHTLYGDLAVNFVLGDFLSGGKDEPNEFQTSSLNQRLSHLFRERRSLGVNIDGLTWLSV